MLSITVKEAEVTSTWTNDSSIQWLEWIEIKRKISSVRIRILSERSCSTVYAKLNLYDYKQKQVILLKRFYLKPLKKGLVNFK